MPLSNIVQVTTPLSADDLRIRRMTGREELGRLFSYELELLSPKANITLSDLLGQSITVHLQLEGERQRHFNGYVSRFSRAASSGRYTVYRATLRPWLWLLTRTSDCRIFQNSSVPDVLKEVFRAYGFTDFDEALSGSYEPKDYIVQYRESAFNFVSRLMEQAGIYYFFKHEDGKHVLTLADSYGAHETAPGYAEVPYYPPQPGERRERDHVDGWRVAEQIQTGRYMLNDYDFERPKASLQSKLSAPEANTDLEMYDYPGEYTQEADGDFYVRVRLEELQMQCEQVEGRGNARGLAPGGLFSLTGFPNERENREYLITSCAYDIEADDLESGAHAAHGASFRSSFTAIDSKVSFRSRRITPKPTIAGPQTAIVVGKAGEDIWTDQYGRVKVQFHWDREGKSDENSSCWVRVAQYWAGSRFGSIHIPRIGQEVMVEFLEGDPDRPIVTGRVYNGNNMPPYDLPANQTQSGWKTRSSKGGNPDNFNEIRFEDKAGEEQVFVQAEKDLEINVKNNESRTVGADRNKSVGGNETVSIGKNRTETVTGDESITITGGRTENVAADESITIGAGRTETVGADETISIGANQTITVGANRSKNVGANETVTIGGNRTETVASSETVSIGGPRTINIAAAEAINVAGGRTVNVAVAQATDIGAAHSLNVGGNQSISVGGARDQSIDGNDQLTVGKKLQITATDEVVIKTGDASITMKKNGDIVISGKNITVKGSGKVNVKADGDVALKGSKIAQN